jgi:hypothetical protein
MRGLKRFSIPALFSVALLAIGTAGPAAPTAQGQISINIGVQPVCSYGYYDYSPYACAPMGFYGSGYFYNGIFLGMGPWAGWGYGHGWGEHRFVNDGGGRYHGGGGAAAGRAFAGHPDHMQGAGARPANHVGGGAAMRSNGAVQRTGNGGAHPAAARPSAAREGAPHAAAAHSGGGGAAHAAPAAHGGGGSPHGGGGAAHGGHEGGGEHK